MALIEQTSFSVDELLVMKDQAQEGPDVEEENEHLKRIARQAFELEVKQS